MTLDAVARWAALQDLESIPAAVTRQAKRCIIDTIACGIAGSRMEITRRTHDFASANFQSGAARLLSGGAPLAAPAAALVNAIACHALDFDDTCYDGIVHASAVVLPAALAACAMANRSGADALLAYCVGCQVEVALGRLLTDALYDRGWFNTALLGTLGAAAAASKALRLQPREFRHALALAAVEASGIRAVLGSETKPYFAGRAAEAGVRCALLARAGVTAPARVLEGPNGFISTHLGAQIGSEVDGSIERWAFVDPGFALKLYPACSAVQAAAEALHLLCREMTLEARDIRTITVAGTHLVVRSLRFAAPRTFQEAQFSMPFALACILKFGTLGPEQLHTVTSVDPALRELMSRITLVEDPTLEGRIENGAPCPEPAYLKVELVSGSIIEQTRLAASGMPQRAFTDAQLIAKLETCLRFAGRPAHAAGVIFDRWQTIERAHSVDALLVAHEMERPASAMTHAIEGI